MKMKTTNWWSWLVVCGAAMVGSASTATVQAQDAKVEDINVVIKTEKGDIKAVVYASKTPVTAASCSLNHRSNASRDCEN